LLNGRSFWFPHPGKTSLLHVSNRITAMKKMFAIITGLLAIALSIATRANSRAGYETAP
jgi:hypothetical protein